ncbi:MAG: hypothetical protein H6737_21840 [Alphaproteobacteria bacterium]|nr:hypothetical protein [Alphaproteobacteria bacterium]MCB9700191.1 hypothetical protein [Alphaproteobacteria bacterium]
MLLLLLACSRTPPPAEPLEEAPPMPFQALGERGDLRVGDELGDLAGDGAAIEIPAALAEDAQTFRDALVASLAAGEPHEVEGFGTFELHTRGQQGSLVVLRPAKPVKMALNGGGAYEPTGTHAALWAFVVAESAEHAVHIEHIGWFGQKALGPIPVGGREVPARKALYFRAEQGLLTTLRFPLDP